MTPDLTLTVATLHSLEEGYPKESTRGYLRDLAQKYPEMAELLDELQAHRDRFDNPEFEDEE